MATILVSVIFLLASTGLITKAGVTIHLRAALHRHPLLLKHQAVVTVRPDADHRRPSAGPRRPFGRPDSLLTSVRKTSRCSFRRKNCMHELD